VCSGEFVSVEGPLLVRNILSEASKGAKDMMKNMSDADPLVNIDVGAGVPVSEIIGDGPAITGILQELIFNGLKHSFEDEVRVRAWSDKYTATRLYFSVENTGILVAPEDIPRIFDPFTPTSTSEGNVRGQGVCLGLAKSKRIADILRGDLTVESDTSTVFTLGLDFRHSKELVFNTAALDVNLERHRRTLSDCEDDSESGSIGSLDKDPGRRISVLVVDDSPLILKMFDKMMSRVGITVEVCSKPLVALEKVVDKKYDAIFLDVIMPVMTGITCAQEIRKGDSVNKNTPILVLTADMSTETRQLTSYISDSILLSKPARISVVTRSLISVIGDKEKTEYLRAYCE
jgi:CheY-like chemotaxis protein